MKLRNLLVGAAAISLSSIAYAQEAIELKMKFTPGISMEQNIEMDMDMDMNVQGQAQNSKVEMDMNMLVDMLKHEKGTQMDMQFKRMAMKVVSAGMEVMNFDTAVDQGSPEFEAMAAILDQKFSAIIKDGKILEVKGADNNQMLKQAGVDDKMLLQQMKQQMQMLPKKAVKVGDEWESIVETAFGGGQTAKGHL